MTQSSPTLGGSSGIPGDVVEVVGRRVLMGMLEVVDVLGRVDVLGPVDVLEFGGLLGAVDVLEVVGLLEVVRSLTDLPAWQQLAIVAMAAFVAATIVDVITKRLVRQVARRTDRELDDVVAEELALPLYATVVLGAVYFSAGLVAALPAPFDRLSEDVARLAVSVIVLAWTYAAIRVGRRTLEVVREGGTQYQFAPILKNVWTFGVVLAAFLTIIGIWGIDLTPILATGGVLAIVVGFAARDTIANFIGGISLFFDNTYKLGDFVLLETGERGTVVDIGIRSTTVLTRDYVLVTLPNAVLNTAQIINQSAPERRMRIRVDVRVPYDADLDVAEACMFEAAAEAPNILESPAPQVRIQQYAERGIEYELQVYIANPTRQARARHQVYRELAAAFDRAGIDPPYAGRELRLADDEMDGRVVGGDGRTRRRQAGEGQGREDRGGTDREDGVETDRDQPDRPRRDPRGPASQDASDPPSQDAGDTASQDAGDRSRRSQNGDPVAEDGDPHQRHDGGRAADVQDGEGDPDQSSGDADAGGSDGSTDDRR